jgi:hypothetical protein
MCCLALPTAHVAITSNGKAAYNHRTNKIRPATGHLIRPLAGTSSQLLCEVVQLFTFAIFVLLLSGARILISTAPV